MAPTLPQQQVGTPYVATGRRASWYTAPPPPHSLVLSSLPHLCVDSSLSRRRITRRMDEEASILSAAPLSPALPAAGMAVVAAAVAPTAVAPVRRASSAASITDWSSRVTSLNGFLLASVGGKGYDEKL